MNALLIAGTDHGVGKTVVMTALAAYWQRYCAPSLGMMKPLHCNAPQMSGRSDRDLYGQLFALDQHPDEITPLYFESTLPPPIAAEQEGRRIELDRMWHVFEHLTQTRSMVLVEGWGGLGSPVTYETTVADLAWDWRIPVVLVVPVIPGAIAQAVANVALARQARLHLKGIVLNCVHPCHVHERDDWANVELIQSLTHKPVLGCIPHLTDTADLNKLAQVASNLKLEQFLLSPSRATL